MSLKTKSSLIQVVQTILEDDSQVIVQHFNVNGDLLMQSTAQKPAVPPKVKPAAPEAPPAPASPKPGKK